VRSTTVPNSVSQKSLQIDVTTADASIAATDIYLIEYNVEGYDYFPIHNGEDIRLSFWVISSKTGICCVSFQNSAQNRSYVVEYTVNSADTFEKKTITVTTDTLGTWLFTNGIGMKINFVLAAGANFQGTAGTWNAADDRATSNQVNVMDSATNNFHISQVKLERGTVATNFETSMKSFQDEVADCQRYLEKSYELEVAPGTVTDIGAVGFRPATTAHIHDFRYNVTKRALPTQTLYNPRVGATTGSWRDITAGTNTTVASFQRGTTGSNVATSGATVGNNHLGHYVSDSDF
jgi:hypothetical protein